MSNTELKKVFITILAFLGFIVPQLYLPVWSQQPVLSAPAIDKPQIVPTALFVNKSTVITATVQVTRNANLLSDSINLIRVDDQGKAIAVLTRMYDDGTHGDMIPGDGKFTAKITLNEPNPGNVNFAVTAAYKGTLLRAKSPNTVATVDPLPCPVGQAPQRRTDICVVPKLYYYSLTTREMRKMNIDGSNDEHLYTTTAFAWGGSNNIDWASDTIYYYEDGFINVIHRMKLEDATNHERLYDYNFFANPNQGLVIDPVLNILMLGQYYNGIWANNDLNGSGTFTQIVSRYTLLAHGNTGGIQYAYQGYDYRPSQRYLYFMNGHNNWGPFGSRKLWRVHPDGTGLKYFYSLGNTNESSGAGFLNGSSIDLRNNILYFVNTNEIDAKPGYLNQRIQYVPLSTIDNLGDGEMLNPSAITIIFGPVEFSWNLPMITDIIVDSYYGYIWYASNAVPYAGIYRMNIDGTNPTLIKACDNCGLALNYY